MLQMSFGAQFVFKLVPSYQQPPIQHHGIFHADRKALLGPYTQSRIGPQGLYAMTHQVFSWNCRREEYRRGRSNGLLFQVAFAVNRAPRNDSGVHFANCGTCLILVVAILTRRSALMCSGSASDNSAAAFLMSATRSIGSSFFASAVFVWSMVDILAPFSF